MSDHSENYDKRKQRAATRDREESAAGKEIGELPGIKNPKRRKACERNLLKYLLTYHKESYPLDFSTDQFDFIEAIQKAVLTGGAQAQAMPRGSGKTTIILCACGWAIAYGHRRFIVLIGAEQDAADELADDVRTMWETNDLLAEDFPEIAAPIRALEGVVNRAKAQTMNGRQTFMRWSGAKLVMPTVWVPPNDPRGRKIKPNSAGLVPTIASGSVIRARGLLARIRGMKSTTATGETIRPDLVLVEDFQTDASAKSPTQCASREKTIAGAVLGLAGPGKRIAAFATCTVIVLGDAADRILNRKLYPKWKGKRCRLVNKWPTGEVADKHWHRYHELRQVELEAGEDNHPKATAFYKKNRKAMDVGADVPWAARKFPHELSAVEHAQNLRFDNPETFDAEYQNEPKDNAAALASELRILNSDEHCLNVASSKRYEIPIDCQWLSVGIDVQKTLLYYAVVAVNAEFGGVVVDYGTWPEQNTHYFRLDEIEKTLHQATGKANDGAAIRDGLSRLVEMLSAKQFVRDDGLLMPIDRGLVDAGFMTPDVYKWSKGTTAPYLPSMGFGVGAKQKAWDTMQRKRGERVGHGWRMPPTAKTAGARRVDIDTNTWKSAVLSRFALPDGEPGRWQLFKRPPVMHRLAADHLASEYPIKTSGRGRELFEWQKRPNAENHILDAVIGAAVAANMAGARLPEETVLRSSKPPNSAVTRRRSVVEQSSTGGLRAEEKRKDKPSLAELRAAKRKAA